MIKKLSIILLLLLQQTSYGAMNKNEATNHIVATLARLLCPEKYTTDERKWDALQAYIQKTTENLLKSKSHGFLWLSSHYDAKELSDGVYEAILMDIENLARKCAYEMPLAKLGTPSQNQQLIDKTLRSIREQIFDYIALVSHNEAQMDKKFCLGDYLLEDLKDKINKLMVQEARILYSDQVDDAHSCFVCFDPYDEKNVIQVILPCCHHLCKNCLDVYKAKYIVGEIPCPTCKQDINEKGKCSQG